MYKNSVLRYVNTPKGWTSWIVLAAIFTLIAWVIAESIPIFSDLLSLASALFVSGFSFWIPAVMWVVLLREGSLFSRKNIFMSLGCLLAFIIGIVTLGAGTYATIKDIVSSSPQFQSTGTNRSRSRKPPRAPLTAHSRAVHLIRYNLIHFGVLQLQAVFFHLGTVFDDS